MFWKYKELSRWTKSDPHKIEIYDDRWNKTYVQWRFKTKVDPFFSGLHAYFCPSGQKIVPENISSVLNSPLSLAVWFMDDGGRRNDSYGLFLNTLSFTKEENE